MRITNPNQITAGMEIFCIDGFSGSTYECHITKVEVVDVPLPPQSDSTAPKVWVMVKLLAIQGQYITSLNLSAGVWFESDSCRKWIGDDHQNSVQDMGIIANTYNKHQVFTNVVEAKLYGEGKLNLSDIAEAPAVGAVGDYDRAMKVI